jgi:hypothetical protein
MAQPTPELIAALRETALRLRDGADYRWTHQGACNCGHLAQTITRLSKAEIHAMAVEKEGIWEDHVIAHCSYSGYPIDHIIDKMLEIGLSYDDIRHLEKLSSPVVLRRLSDGRTYLDYRQREDVVTYMELFADLLQEQLLATMPAPIFTVFEHSHSAQTVLA